MAQPRFQRSIRFSEDEWNTVCEAAEQRQMKPAEFVREAAAGVAAREIDLDDGRLTPELIELIERTFRGVHLLTFLKRAELAGRGKEIDFERATEAGWIAQSETLDCQSAFNMAQFANCMH